MLKNVYEGLNARKCIWRLKCSKMYKDCVMRKIAEVVRKIAEFMRKIAKVMRKIAEVMRKIAEVMRRIAEVMRKIAEVKCKVAEVMYFLKCIFLKCFYPKCIFAKCTRLACLLSFASLFNKCMLVIFLTHFYRQRKVLAELPRQGPHLRISCLDLALWYYLVMTCSVFVLTNQIEMAMLSRTTWLSHDQNHSWKRKFRTIPIIIPMLIKSLGFGDPIGQMTLS